MAHLNNKKLNSKNVFNPEEKFIMLSQKTLTTQRTFLWSFEENDNSAHPKISDE